MKLFISHADPDQLIARPFANLLRTSTKATSVFCSSDKGAIENGDFFVQYILNELNTADGTVSLLSPNYLKSQFCIAELGISLVAKYQRKAIFNSFIIPPTRFRDLQGMLFGVQSEPLDETASLELLCTRLGGDPTDAAWKAARDAFLLQIKPITDVRKAEEKLRDLIIHDFFPEPGSDTEVTFRSKIRVLLKNNTGLELEASKVSWTASSIDVPLQTPSQGPKVLQVETSQGWHANAWTPEAEAVKVPPGAVFRLWLGLHQSIAPDDLRRRHEGQEVGILTLRVKVGGVELPWEKRL